MASQFFNLIGQEEEELVALGTRQSRVPTPQSRPNSRMEEMLWQLMEIQEKAVKVKDATAKSLGNRIIENARALETKMSALHTSTGDKLSKIAYKQIEQIAEMSDLVDRISTVERWLQGSPFTGSDPTWRSLTPPGQKHALMASAPDPLSLTTPSSLAMERSKTAKSSDLLPPIPPFTQELEVTDATKSNLIYD